MFIRRTVLLLGVIQDNAHGQLKLPFRLSQ